MSDQPVYTVGSSNVFADLDYPDAEEALLKAQLAHEIGAVLRERQLTQAAAGQLLGLDPSEVAALVRGKLARLSIERLLRCLTALERDITIMVGPKKQELAQIELISEPPR